jgi:hypothetical protein
MGTLGVWWDRISTGETAAAVEEPA